MCQFRPRLWHISFRNHAKLYVLAVPLPLLVPIPIHIRILMFILVPIPSSLVPVAWKGVALRPMDPWLEEEGLWAHSSLA